MPTGNYAVEFWPASEPWYAPTSLPGCGANDADNDVSYRVTRDTRAAGWNTVAFTVLRAPQDNPAYGCTGCAPGCRMDVASFAVDRTTGGWTSGVRGLGTLSARSPAPATSARFAAGTARWCGGE